MKLNFGTPDNNLLAGSSESDMILGLAGIDTIFGGDRDDYLNGNLDNDMVYGGIGNDTAQGGKGNDMVCGDEGDDMVFGDLGIDTQLGGDGNDMLYGNVGDDMIFGNSGNDSVYAGKDNDTLRGGRGNDVLEGQEGNDWIYGDLGVDTCTGGDGKDHFVIGTGLGGATVAEADLVTDFVRGVDVIELINGLNFAGLSIVQDNSGTVIQHKTTAEFLLRLQGINSLAESDFAAVSSVPNPTPTPTPNPTPTPTPNPTPTPTPNPTPTPTPNPTPTPTPEPTPTPTPEPTPTPTPNPTPTPTPNPTPTPTPEPTPTPTPEPTPTPTNFDEKFYLVNNFDATQAILNREVQTALEHFQKVGQPEGRAGAPDKPSTFNIEFDYRFDTNGFFNDPKRREVLEAAASYWEAVIQDEFPDVPAGTEFWITNPQTDQKEKVVLDKPIDDLKIFVGAGSLIVVQPDGTKAKAVGMTKSLGFGYEDENSFNKALPDRINGANFEPYVASIAFDTDTIYSVDSTPLILSDDSSQNAEADLFLTAIHEMYHALGFCEGIAAFDAQRKELLFAGPNAKAINNGNPIPLRDPSHTAGGLFGTGGIPSIFGSDPAGQKKAYIPTKVDLAILSDLGYKIQGFTSQDTTPTPATEGNDTLLGTDAGDILNGLGGNDVINGVAGNDSIDGGAGDDAINGDAGNDTLLGGAGNDTLLGGAGDDSIDGGVGNDAINGDAGNDTLLGGADDDQFFGGDGNDSIDGGDGNDSINDGAGDDTLLGGAGDDQFFGGDGNDLFVFEGVIGADTINNFVVADEKIQISASYGLTINDIFSNPQNIFDGPVTNAPGLFSKITLSAGNTITIFHDVSLTQANFTIV